VSLRLKASGMLFRNPVQLDERVPAAYLRTISSVWSVDPSLTMIHFWGRNVCEITA
jgi:hypothetical protein